MICTARSEERRVGNDCDWSSDVCSSDLSGPAHRKLRSVAQEGHAAVLCVQLDLLEPLDVEQIRAVNAHEAIGVELGRELTDRLLLAQAPSAGDDLHGKIGRASCRE